jgi:hypothetical protein
MSKEQAAKMMKLDAEARAEFKSAMTEIDKLRSSSDYPV